MEFKSEVLDKLTKKGVKLGILFVQFHKRFAGPLTALAVNTENRSKNTPDSKVEKQIIKIDAELDRLSEMLKCG